MLDMTKLSTSLKRPPLQFQDMLEKDSIRYEVFICRSTFVSGTKFYIEVIRCEDRCIAYFSGSRWFDTLEELEINLNMNFPNCVIEECNDSEECMINVYKTVKGIKKEVLDNACMNHMMLV